MQSKALEQTNNECSENLMIESKESESFNIQSENINVFLKEQMEFLKSLDS